jgi:hypothetical protein
MTNGRVPRIRFAALAIPDVRQYFICARPGCSLPALGNPGLKDHAGRWQTWKAAMTDYWVSKLFFDLQHDPKLADEYRANMAAVIDRYNIKPEFRAALLGDDVGKLAPAVNAYLLRFYFQIRGMPQDEFIAKLHAMNVGGGSAKEKSAHG